MAGQFWYMTWPISNQTSIFPDSEHNNGNLTLEGLLTECHFLNVNVHTSVPENACNCFEG